MYAIIATGGRQYRVKEDDVLEMNRIEGEEGAKITFDEVIAVGEGKELNIGAPTVKGAKVEAQIVEHLRGPKLTVFKMKRRKGYRKKQGHRQELTKVKIAAVKT